MADKQKFSEYLAKIGKKQDYVHRCTEFINSFNSALDTEMPTVEAIDKYFDDLKRNSIGSIGGVIKATYKFLDDYADYSNSESLLFANAYREHILKKFEEPARNAVNAYKKAIIFIPDNTKIDPYFLDGLTNEEFVDAFKSLQQLVYSIYEEIERTSPFDWGWGSWKDIEGYGIYHNRIMEALGALAESGYIDGDILVVDKKEFYKNDMCKEKSQINLTVNGFMDMGFFIEEFDNKKSEVFRVSCPDTPNLIIVLNAYYKERRRDCCKCHKAEKYPCMEDCFVSYVNHHDGIFSYRFVEEHPPNTHDTEIFFLAVTDSAPEELRKILFYLHDEAEKHGYKIKPWTTVHNGCIRYWKFDENWGTKSWLPVGSGTSWMDFFYTQINNTWAAKSLEAGPLFKRIFKSHPDKAEELMQRFPGVFTHEASACYNCCAENGSNDCKHRISFILNGKEHYGCAKRPFCFQNPSLDDVKLLLEMYKLEWNIKPIV